jgi:hypothetical protein
MVMADSFYWAAAVSGRKILYKQSKIEDAEPRRKTMILKISVISVNLRPFPVPDGA